MNEQHLRLIGVLVIIAFFIWRGVVSFRESDEPGTLLKRWLGTLALVLCGTWIIGKTLGAGGYVAGFGAPILMAGFAIVIGIIWAPSWGSLLASPLTSLFDGGDAYDREQPLYGKAEARRKRGAYQEAIEEVEKQLAKFPGDLTGTLMLVDLYVRDLHQMSLGQAAVESYLDHGPHHPKNTFLALAHLADAYLKYDSNRAQAEACLKRIQVECEGTDQEMIAAQRLAHLVSEEELAARSTPKRIEVKEYDRRIGLTSTPCDLRAPEKTPEELANECVLQLEAHPLDLEARENLAMIYADHYQRLDLALDQLETMTNFRNQSPRNVVHWLNRMADLHIKLAGDVANAKACLLRIGERFPDTAHEAQAVKRIHTLGREKKARQN